MASHPTLADTVKGHVADEPTQELAVVDEASTKTALPSVYMEMDAVERHAYQARYDKHLQVSDEAEKTRELMRDWLGEELAAKLKPRAFYTFDSYFELRESYRMLIGFKGRFWHVQMELPAEGSVAGKPRFLAFPVSNFNFWVDTPQIKLGVATTPAELCDYLLEMTQDIFADYWAERDREG